ncbi:uncharacterized protein L199_001372 [Kwoniella botswanensis]|uniref:uncharacterized protein n=1 Tax=Kwoniella botswanensis TaxID=1268659 RepID=UPI00315CA60A
MGTRGVLGFIVAAKRKACYNHYDSYPDRLGVRIVMFILALTPEQRWSMIERLKEVSSTTSIPLEQCEGLISTLILWILWIDEEFDSPPSEELIQHYTSKDFHLDSYEKEDKLKYPAEFEHRRRTPHTWSELLRGMQGAPCLPQIISGELKHLLDRNGFEFNWLCCEYAYWIDFENQTFEMTVGQEGKWSFNQLSEKGRYWRRLVDDELWTERLIEQGKKSFTAQDMLAGLDILLALPIISPPIRFLKKMLTLIPPRFKIPTRPRMPDSPKESGTMPDGEFCDSLGNNVTLVNSNTMDASIDDAAPSHDDHLADGRA